MGLIIQASTLKGELKASRLILTTSPPMAASLKTMVAFTCRIIDSSRNIYSSNAEEILVGLGFSEETTKYTSGSKSTARRPRWNYKQSR
jgi:hypothetical protein